MAEHLLDYVKVYPLALSDDYCDRVVAFFEGESQVKGRHNEEWRRCHEYSNLDYSPLYGEFQV